MSETLSCPFACGYETKDQYEIHLHVEYQHTEGTSPFLVREGSSPGPVQAQAARSAESVQYAECPIEECGEVITLAEFEDHLELHNLETAEAPSASPPGPTTHGYVSPYAGLGHHGPPPGHDAHHKGPDHDRQAASIERWKQLLHMPPAASKEHRAAEPAAPADKQRKRLGKSELGKYAHEDRMPDWLVDLLKREGQVVEHGVIEVLGQLLDENPTTTWAYLCHPSIQHISKLKREGGFCGYRNIQMLSSYIVGARAPGHEHFHRRIPSIFKIQDFIERAWDMGINARGRVETGGVKGSRKYIGTPEAQAMFLGLNIPVRAMGFRDSQAGQAEARLMQHVLEYFEAAHVEGVAKVRRTSLPPIYFQHRGHSLTIVGIEKRTDGALELLVFDPMFRDPPAIRGLVGRVLKNNTSVEKSLKLYRRGNKYLKKYHEFEVLELVPGASRTPVSGTEVDGSSATRHAHH